MSNAAVIGALQVILGGDASALDKVLKGAQSSVAGFAKSIASIAGGIGLEKIISGTIDKVVSTIKDGLDEVNKSAKGAQVAGVAIDEFTKLRYAADFSGVGLDGLSGSLTKLSENMVAASTGAAVPATDAFNRMGISVKNNDGTLKSSTQVLGEIADKFATYRDGAGKAALAQALFGEKGAELIPLLNKGRDGISELGDEAQKFGLVLDSQTQFAVQSLNDNLKRMDAIKQGLALTIAAKLLPSFEQISAAMLNAKENASLMATVADALATGLKVIISVGLQGVLIFERLSAEISAFIGAFKGGSWLSIGDTLSKAFAALDAEGQKTVEAFKNVDETLKGLFTDPNLSWDRQVFGIKQMQSEVAALGATWLRTKDAPAAVAEATRSALQVFLDGQAKRTAGVEAEAAAVGKSASEQAALKVTLEAEAIARARNIQLTDDNRAAIKAASEAAAEAARNLQAANLTQDNLTPQQQRNQLLQQYVDLLNAGKISYDTFSAAALKVQFPSFASAARSATDFQMSIDQLSTSLVNGLSSAFAQVATGQKSAADAFSAFAIQFITQMTEMIAKAILFRVIMAAIGFSGGGEVGTMDVGGQSFVQFKAGGGELSGPGTGTSDSIPVMASNGEFIVNAASTAKHLSLLNAINNDNFPHLAGGGLIAERVPNTPATSVPMVAAPAAAAHATVTVQMQGKVFTREMLAELIDDLNVMHSNGYKLKVGKAA